MENLDVQIQKLGYELAQELDKNEIEKLLGVLANDGVYAMWVFSLDKVKKEKRKFWADKIVEILKLVYKDISVDYSQEWAQEKSNLETDINNLESQKVCDKKSNNFDENKCNDLKEKKKRLSEILNFKLITETFQQLSENLSNLLYFKEVIERVLIYARYHLKAKGNE